MRRARLRPALLLLLAAAAAGARAGGCSRARHALLPLQAANPHKYAHVVCVRVVPGREATLHLLVPAANSPTGQESYARNAHKFAADLAGLGGRKAAIFKQDSFVMVLGDDGSLPRPVLDRLRAARAPLVSHALLGADDVDRVILGPDYHFIENYGFRETIAALDARREPLRDRAPTVFWRGSTTGAPVDAFSPKTRLRGWVGGHAACHRSKLAACVRGESVRQDGTSTPRQT